MRVRLPRPALEAIKELARRGHCTVSQVVRSGLLASMAHAIEPMAELARNRDRCPRRRINAMEAIRQYNKAALYMGPQGLPLARQRQAERERVYAVYRHTLEANPQLRTAADAEVYEFLTHHLPDGRPLPWFQEQFIELVREARRVERASRKRTAEAVTKG